MLAVCQFVEPIPDLTSVRVTGRQVWNKQRKEDLLDVEEVSLGYETKMRWNDTSTWIWSDVVAHEPLVSTEDFEAAQTIKADQGRGRQAQRETGQRVRHPYVLRSLLFCGMCGRKMQAQHSHGQTYYRCRYPREYALAAHVQHPVNVYLRESQLVPPLDLWLSTVFAPHRIDETIRTLVEAQPEPTPAGEVPDERAQAVIADCDARLARYQAALDAGADPQVVAGWTRQVQAERAAALAAKQPGPAGPRLSEADIGQIIETLKDLTSTIKDADPADKARIYVGVGLRLTYHPGRQLVHAEAHVSPVSRGDMGRVRGGIEPIPPQRAMAVEAELTLVPL